MEELRDLFRRLVSWAIGIGERPPLVRAARNVQTQSSTVGSPSAVECQFNPGVIIYISVSVVDTSQGATLVFRGGDITNGAGVGNITLGAELGTTRYQFPVRIDTINLVTGAAGGTLSVWASDDETPIPQC